MARTTKLHMSIVAETVWILVDGSTLYRSIACRQGITCDISKQYVLHYPCGCQQITLNIIPSAVLDDLYLRCWYYCLHFTFATAAASLFGEETDKLLFTLLLNVLRYFQTKRDFARLVIPEQFIIQVHNIANQRSI